MCMSTMYLNYKMTEIEWNNPKNSYKILWDNLSFILILKITK